MSANGLRGFKRSCRIREAWPGYEFTHVRGIPLGCYWLLEVEVIGI